MIQTNLEILNNYNFDKLTERVNIQEVNGKLVQYLFLMADKDSGKILEIAKQEKCYEKMASSPLALHKESLIEPGPYQIELLEPENFPETVATIIQSSLKIFNNQDS